MSLPRWLAFIAVLFASPALGQVVPLQGGPWVSGHAPMYVNNGSAQPVLLDSGGAGGGGSGTGISDMGLTARGPGAGPYAGAGTGPNGENWCDYDAPTTNPGGYHYLCLSPNALGGGLISYGASGAASTDPLYISVNGLTFPLVGGGTVTSVGLTAPAQFSVSNSPITTAGDLGLGWVAQNANTVLAGPGSGAAAAPGFRALVAADLPFPGPTAIGGVTSHAAVTHQFLTQIGTNGTISAAQPAAADLSNGVTGSGAVVLATAPTIAGLTATGSLTATGLVTNADLVNAATTVNGQTCTLGSTCTVTAAATGVTISTTAIGSGTSGRVLYDNAGVLGELTTTGSGSAVLASSPSLVTPNIGAATGTTLTTTTTVSAQPPPLPGGQSAVNYHQITGDNVAATGFILGNENQYIFGGSSVTGGRIANYDYIANTAITNASNTNRNYVGHVGEAYTNVGDGGTDTAGGAKGAFFGENPEMFVDAGATNLLNATAMEVDTFTAAGSTVRYLTGMQIAGANATHGVEVDTALAIYGTTSSGGFGPHIGWGTGILFTDIGGVSPFYSSSTIIGYHWQGATPTILNGIDFTGFTFTGNAFQSPGVLITGNGGLNLTNANADMEFGSTTGANTPLIDWHSSGNAIDYDARLIASGGSASSGNGLLQALASGFFVNAGLADAEQVSILAADNTAPTNVNTAQSVFSSGQSTFTATAATSYQFEAEYEIDSTGATSNSLGVLFGGTATFTSIGYDAIATNGTTSTTASATSGSRGSAATLLTVTPAVAAATQRLVKLRGTLRVNAGGTIIPEFQYSAAPGAAPVVRSNSYFRLWPITTNIITKLGGWS
jgi:hypothetical protein